MSQVEEMKPINVSDFTSYQDRQTFIVSSQPRTATSSAPLIAPPGAPLEGVWVEDRYCGLITWLVTLVGGFPCSYFCPCDRRTVWLAGGAKYDEKGAVLDDYVFYNPCPPGTMCHKQPASLAP